MEVIEVDMFVVDCNTTFRAAVFALNTILIIKVLRLIIKVVNQSSNTSPTLLILPALLYFRIFHRVNSCLRKDQLDRPPTPPVLQEQMLIENASLQTLLCK